MGSINTGNSAIYDLSDAPITFDFVNFLAFARLAVALKSKDPSFFLTIIADSWRNSTWREHQYDINDRLWRLHNLIIPVCSVTQALWVTQYFWILKVEETTLEQALQLRQRSTYLMSPFRNF